MRFFPRRGPAPSEKPEAVAAFFRSAIRLMEENRGSLANCYVNERPDMVDSRRGPERSAAREGTIAWLVSKDGGLKDLATFARNRVNKSKVSELADILENGDEEGREAARKLAMIFVDSVYEEEVRKEALRKLILSLVHPGSHHSETVLKELISPELTDELRDCTDRETDGFIGKMMELQSRIEGQGLNEEELVATAMNAGDHFAKAALQVLVHRNDWENIADVACKAENESIRMKALEIILDVAQHQMHVTVCYLTKIAESGEFDDTRELAREGAERLMEKYAAERDYMNGET